MTLNLRVYGWTEIVISSITNSKKAILWILTDYILTSINFLTFLIYTLLVKSTLSIRCTLCSIIIIRIRTGIRNRTWLIFLANSSYTSKTWFTNYTFTTWFLNTIWINTFITIVTSNKITRASKVIIS